MVGLLDELLSDYGTVVHVNSGKHFDYYVGRPSLLGNPFRVGEGVTHDRAIRLFAHYAIARMDLDPAFVSAIRACKGKTIACWCRSTCHAWVILFLANGEIELAKSYCNGPQTQRRNGSGC